MPTVPFDEYKVYYWSPKKAKRLEQTKTIYLNYNKSHIGTIHFYPDGHSSIPSDQVYAMSNGVRYYLYYYDSQYEQILDLVRNEKPCYIDFVGKVGSLGTFTNGEGDIRTGYEEVGEEESP